MIHNNENAKRQHPIRVMLGIDFIGDNLEGAMRSLRLWSAYIGADQRVLLTLGMSHFSDRGALLPGSDALTPRDAAALIARGVLPPVTGIAQWTSDIDKRLIHVLRSEGINATPFFNLFNYGSVVNRLLLMSHAKGCDVLMRVDPGTAPPLGISFGEILDEHLSRIENDPTVVVSRRYAERLTLRDDYVRDRARIDAHRRLVAATTGMDVKNQITGGALLSFRPPGIPAICFPGSTDGPTLVWASDDGIYDTLSIMEHGVTTVLFKSHPVTRFDSVGMPKPWQTYYRGIVGRVLLGVLLRGEKEAAGLQAAERFLTALKALAAVPKDAAIDAVAPPGFRAAVRVGVENYGVLRKTWFLIADILREEIDELTRID